MPAAPSPHPRDPHHPPHPYADAPYTQSRAGVPFPASPAHPTYPWQPPAPPAPPPHRTPRHAPLGHHSDLRRLRRAYRWQRRTATLTALGYFVLFLTLSAYAPSFMTGTSAGGVPTGLLLAVGQVPVTWLAVALYEVTARRRVDPLAALIRRQAVVDARREAAR
ncbi:DUF485 domain-containing protein [Streptomyces lusitanus]|uniref:DUF485 domain-containing protein n=1 Tax=Streptomyces lusitanus TaxID=68232 RepID=A0ABU3JR06_9ACTN|nr:DUF485 domain-containing protein [Streptomyces lusitanus]